MKKMAVILGLCALMVQGCAVTNLAGQAIRSGMKDIEFNVTNGYDMNKFSHSRIAISTTAANEDGNNIAAFAMLMGGKKPTGNQKVTSNVYTDMILTEFLKKGFDARAISDTLDLNDPNDIDSYKQKGFQIIVKGSLKIDTSTSTWGAMTGGDYAYSGIKEFTLKGIDTASGRIIFIVTGSYGNPKEAKTVATDIAEAFSKKING